MTAFLQWWAKSHPLRRWPYGPKAREYEAGIRIGPLSIQLYWLKGRWRND